MEALRRVVYADELPVNIFDIPESFKRKKLEIIIIPFDDEKTEKKSIKKAGALSSYSNSALIATEKSGFEAAMREKHENS